VSESEVITATGMPAVEELELAGTPAQELKARATGMPVAKAQELVMAKSAGMPAAAQDRLVSKSVVEDQVRKAAEDQAEGHNREAPVSSQQSSKLRRRQSRRNVRTPIKYQDFVMERPKRIGIIKAMISTPTSLTSLESGAILQADTKEQTKAKIRTKWRNDFTPSDVATACRLL